MATKKILVEAPVSATAPTLEDFAQILAQMGQAVTSAHEQLEAARARIAQLEQLTAGLVGSMKEQNEILAELARARRL
jgi:hypothetical protein